jgi:thioredoxin-related protein
MTRLVIVALVLVVAVALNKLFSKRTVLAPTQADPSMPTQVDRKDFSEPSKEWLVLAFTSSTCNTCADIERKAVVLKSQTVAVEICEYTAHRELHKKYAIDAVPTLLIADGQGIVRKGFLGPASATDIWAALARVREGTPDPHEGDCN